MEYTFFSVAHGTLCKIGNFRHKVLTNIRKFNNCQNLSDHNGIILEITNNKTTENIQTHGD
jgi:hypothetical protein